MTDVDAYLATFETEARKFGLHDARDIAADVRSHINEAVSYGKSEAAVLSSLGTPKALARAYAVELLMQEPKPGGPGFAKLLGIVALGAVGGIVTLAVVPALGGISFGFAISGVVMLATGIFGALGFHSQYVHFAGVSPWIVIAMAPVFLAVAWGAARMLGAYLHFVGRQFTRSLPGRSPA